MNIECIVALPRTAAGALGLSMNNFKKQWAQIFMEQREDDCFNAVLMDISGGCGIVKMGHGILIKLPVEYICLKE